MMIMNIVWPLTGLYFPILGLIAYYRLGKEKKLITCQTSMIITMTRCIIMNIIVISHFGKVSLFLQHTVVLVAHLGT